MSTRTHLSMTNHHVPGLSAAPRLMARVGAVLHTWRDRRAQRYELTQWTDRDIRDAGQSRGDVVYEAGKPFWRA